MDNIPSIGHWWTGALSSLQSVMAIVSFYDVPEKRGSSKIGWHDHGFWICPEDTIDGNGFVSTPEVVYLPRGGESEWNGKLDYPKKGFHSVVAPIFGNILKLNKPNAIIPIVAWFFGVPFKPLWNRKVGGYPVLNVTGTRGSGKSTLLRIMGRISGYKTGAVLFGCDQTNFVLLKLLSSTTSVPLILDEYKHDMDDKRREALIRYIRRSYDGESEYKGNANQTMTEYTLTAPLVLAGEVDITESAMLERFIRVPLQPADITDEGRQAFEQIRHLQLNAFAPEYVKFVLRTDFATELSKASQLATEMIPASTSDRVANNLKALIFGFQQFIRFGRELNFFDESTIAPLNEYLANAVKASHDAVCGSSGTVKLALDYFIEHLATMAETGRITKGQHYDISPDDQEIYLRLNACFAEFKRYARETRLDDEVVTELAYRRQIRENHQSGLYVSEVSRVVTMSALDAEDGQGFNAITSPLRKRCTILNIEKARQYGIDNLDGFVVDNSDS